MFSCFKFFDDFAIVNLLVLLFLVRFILEVNILLELIEENNFLFPKMYLFLLKVNIFFSSFELFLEKK